VLTLLALHVVAALIFFDSGGAAGTFLGVGEDPVRCVGEKKLVWVLEK
jgi:hypothetical protein